MEPTKEVQEIKYISNDIWFHLANYIAPEDVQRYALICTQSANSLNSCIFWLQLYRHYCQKSCGEKWILKLPGWLQMDQIKGCDRNTMRQRVIQALFYCYDPFKKRLKTNYKLESLEGRICVSFWHNQVQCVWLMCYKFKHNLREDTMSFENNEEIIVNDWESLAEEENILTNMKPGSSRTNDLNGVRLLIISCDRFIPFSSDLVYNHTTGPFRLAASRELLSTDMRSTNLELDFISATRDQTITIKYTKIVNFKVVPWWHPDFRIFNKCE